MFSEFVFIASAFNSWWLVASVLPCLLRKSRYLFFFFCLPISSPIPLCCIPLCNLYMFQFSCLYVSKIIFLTYSFKNFIAFIFCNCLVFQNLNFSCLISAGNEKVIEIQQSPIRIRLMAWLLQFYYNITVQVLDPYSYWHILLSH